MGKDKTRQPENQTRRCPLVLKNTLTHHQKRMEVLKSHTGAEISDNFRMISNQYFYLGLIDLLMCCSLLEAIVY